MSVKTFQVLSSVIFVNKNETASSEFDLLTFCPFFFQDNSS